MLDCAALCELMDPVVLDTSAVEPALEESPLPDCEMPLVLEVIEDTVTGVEVCDEVIS